MKKWLVHLWLLFIWYPTFAQLSLETVKYLKLERRKGKDYRTLILENKDIIILHNSTEPAKSFNRLLHFYYLDKNLKQIWQSSVTISRFNKIVDWRSSKDYIYILIATTSNHKYKFLKVNLDSSADHFEIIEWKNIFKNFIIRTFLTFDYKVLLIGHIDGKPNIIYFNIDNEEQNFTILPSINQLKKTKLHNIHVDHKNQIITTLLYRAGRNLEKNLYLNQYNFEGNILRNTIIELNRDESLLTFRIVKLKHWNWLIVGTYSYKYQKKAQGIYCFRMQEDKLISQKFYAFHNFKYIFKDLKPKKESNLKKRIQKRLHMPKALPYAYHVILHKLYYKKETISLLGEIVEFENPSQNRNAALVRPRFSPNMAIRHNNQSPTYDGTYFNHNINLELLSINESPVTFYRYQKAFICSLDLEGRLLWDNLFIFPKDTRSPLPQELLSVNIMSDSLLFVQNEKVEINYILQPLKQFNKATPLRKLDSSLTNKNYDFSFYESGGIQFWFEDYFLGQGVRGYTSEEHQTNDEQGSYGFFYLQKIKYKKPNSPDQKFHYIDYE